jgi:DNA-binding response OmpR family regulator
MPTPKHILLVEDDEDIADLLDLHLSDEGHEVDCVGDGDEALDRALDRAYDLIILDIMLPGRDGFDICRRIRQEKRQLPILMVTAKTEEIDKVLGLELGADDYITKPFSIREVMARVKAIFRRVEVDREEAADDGEAPVELGDLVVDPQKRKVILNGETVDLTSKEFELLLLFVQHPGKAFSRQELLDEVWGYQGCIGGLLTADRGRRTADSGLRGDGGPRTADGGSLSLPVGGSRIRDREWQIEDGG